MKTMGSLRRLLLGASLLLPAPAFADTIEQQTGWAAWFNTTRFNEHWGLTSDAQLRSSDDWEQTQTVLLRPGLTYYLSPRSNLTLGYAWVGTLNHPSGNLEEHRIWQQFVHTQSLGRAALAHRFRLEQRFVEPTAGADRRFSQRLRYFLRAVIPLGAGQVSSFDHGPFVALQNEVFFNIQHKDAVNNALFDQNRAYAAAGYRFSKRFDLELGYLNQQVNGRVDDTQNHVLQLALYTRF